MIIIADTWKVTPLTILLVLPVLQTIPDSYYEAAGIYGVNGWSQFWKITLTLLCAVSLVVLVLNQTKAVFSNPNMSLKARVMLLLFYQIIYLLQAVLFEPSHYQYIF